MKRIQRDSGSQAVCQKCFEHGHYTYQCKNERVYKKRPSRTQQFASILKKTKTKREEEQQSRENITKEQRNLLADELLRENLTEKFGLDYANERPLSTNTRSRSKSISSMSSYTSGDYTPSPEESPRYN
ncbi:hypothetical protein SJAG_06431 [Schizosaccharomyces japonicus yFS275]|uniref:Uncharacterized protein n=1 Tax=Schizosaccharomyces japonicus (strain yFS275 / FY16936) TaxID=402676 RepID=T0S0X8_SCHJY|nr:hypothetical protein SJAG_06431 [Schizosaccharomyces japonicus yFS275]EQC52972.1 hypothetical protein SJAG_06431 [Schizosaccharomyces japonicus yFS275]